MNFIQIECPACRSTSLGFLAGTPAPEADPLTSDDVIDMHEFLAGWQGDAHGLVAGDGRVAPRHERAMPPR